jgi:hypothetical protein
MVGVNAMPNDRAAMLANLRTNPSRGQTHPSYVGGGGNNSYSANPYQHSFDANNYSRESQLYALQQREIELQLQQMHLQSLALQEQIFRKQQEHQQRLPGFYGGGGFPPMTAGYADQCFAQQMRGLEDAVDDEETRHLQRRDALQSLQRAQQNRAHELQAPQARKPRLSFNGGGGVGNLAASAMARRSRLSTGNIPDQNATAEPSPPRFTPSHHRRSSSLQSSMSVLSDSHKQMTSANGPTLVLSKPGEAFPLTTEANAHGSAMSPPRPPAKRVTVHVQKPSRGHNKTGSVSSASSDSSTSEVASFESIATSTSSTDSMPAPGKGSLIDRSGRHRPLSIGPGAVISENTTSFVSLNPDAPAFLSASVPQTRLSRSPSPPGFLRGFGHGAVNSLGAVAFRQPKGPVPEGELESKNFASRIRRRAIGALLLGGGRRGSSGAFQVSSPANEAEADEARDMVGDCLTATTAERKDRRRSAIF